MTFVRTFIGYQPSPRADNVKWTTVKIRERATATGFTDADQIDTQAIPNYADPLAPPVLSVTTNDAVLEAGWYQLVFADATGGIELTTPEAASGSGVFLPPAPADVRGRSPYLKQRLPSTPVNADTEQTLREAVLDATAIVESLTGRDLSAPLGTEDGVDLDRLALRAVTLKTERIVAGEGSFKERKGAISGTRLKSFSAGPYSESYFGPGDAASAGALDLDPVLAEVLWALATEAKRQEWLYLWGKAPAAPFAAVQQFDYSHQNPHALRRWRGLY